MVLSEYMEEHPDRYANIIAAYPLISLEPSGGVDG